MCRGVNLKFTPQYISDVILIEPTFQGDNRGYFVEIFRKDLFEEFLGYQVNFLQDNESKSTKGVLRGLHYQIPPYSQSKLIRVTEGKVLDIAVDIRKSSSTFGKYIAIELSAENKYQLFIPCGFAHGFIVLSNSATFSYKVDNYYAPKYDRGIAFDDPKLGINWQLPLADLRLSDKDNKLPNLLETTDLFE